MTEPVTAPVSVVIPAYNSSRYLGATLRSVFAQTVRPQEIIVVDDGSEDDSAALAESFGPPVRVIRQENRGESAARNRGIEAASSEWIAFLDADDLWAPTKLARQLETAAEADVVHTNFYFFGDMDGRVDLAAIPESRRYTPAHVAEDNPFRISSLLVSRRLDLRFPEWTQDGEDLIYFLELARKAKVRLVPEYLTGYRVHRAGQSARADMVVARFRAIEAYLDRLGEEITASEADAVRGGYLRLMCRVATQAKYARQWTQYHAIRDFLARFPRAELLPPEAKSITTERLYPRFAYAIKDRLDAWLRKRRNS
ncbi:hypothetical protein JCM19992_01200 [Thermostilla marina]